MITEATRSCFASLQELVLREGKGGRWLVLTHDNPDPDALASAHILTCILRGAFQQKVTTAYGGIIGRAENQEMVRSLKLPLSHIRHLSLKKYQCFALVDSQPKSGNNQIPPRVVPDVVIDHHPLRPATQTGPFYDVRPKYGATATILAEYLLASGVKPTHALATALIYAIRSETQEFSREYTGPDKAIFDLFFPLANHRLLARIQNPRLPLTYFSNLHDALENLVAVDTLVISHLGAVEQPDIVPEIADLLLRMEGRTWSLATGYYGDRLYLSIRTTNTRADAGGLMLRIVGSRGKGGGHGMIAGGWIDASRLTSLAERKEMQKRLGVRLARELKKNPERLEKIALREAEKAAPAKETAPKPESGAPPPARPKDEA
jgi:nanoRNase/pAp phosphatase (c-di-AMP/oligoRNAs hydrolase)